MDAEEKKRYVFSLSKNDPAFEPKNMERTVQWLLRKGERPYLFQKTKPKELPSGSLVLFSFEGQIFGKATAKEDVQEISRDIQESNRRTGNVVYRYSTVFDATTVEIFPKPYKRKKDLKYILLPERKDFGRVFTPLTPNQYREILRQVERH